MSENARLRRAWEEFPKTAHGRLIEERHPDLRPEWIMRIIESLDSYEWLEYGTTPDGQLRIWIIRAGWVTEIETWIEVVFEERSGDDEFHTAYRLRDKQVEHRLRGRSRRS